MELAKNGLGTTYPNPLVGSVIVHNGIIIGEGWHRKAGEPHAEVHAINSVKNKDLLKESTLYVNLEPCSHHGKTPPCSDLIIQSKIPSVVIGALDTNSLVSGNGIKHLRENGCKVEVGVLEKECLALNKRFYTFHNLSRPYIFLKWAVSRDGFMDINRTINSENEARPTWITNEYSRQLVHQQRTEEQAILIGTETTIKDNPKLNVRNWKGNNPIRVIVDKSLRIPINYSVLDGSVKTIFLIDNRTAISELHSNILNTYFERIDFSKSIVEQILKVLYKHEIQSVIVEGGKQLLESFIAANYWDEARVFTGNCNLNNGVESPQITGETEEKISILGDDLIIYRNTKTS